MTSWQGFDKVILLWRVLQMGSVNWNWPEKPEHCTYVHTEKHTDTSGFFFIQHGGMWRHLPLAHQRPKRGSSPQRGVQFLSTFFYMKKIRWQNEFPACTWNIFSSFLPSFAPHRGMLFILPARHCVQETDWSLSLSSSVKHLSPCTEYLFLALFSMEEWEKAYYLYSPS